MKEIVVKPDTLTLRCGVEAPQLSLDRTLRRFKYSSISEDAKMLRLCDDKTWHQVQEISKIVSKLCIRPQKGVLALVGLIKSRY
jgi:hypothetical protein